MQKIDPIRAWQDGSIPLDETPIRFDRILARARVMKQVLQRLQLAAKREGPVLLLGESGTGKDLVAQSIHSRSRRRNEPFITLNAGAIPHDLLSAELFGLEPGLAGAHRARRGKLALAEGGTLFIDAVENLDLGTQESLLRVLQHEEYSPQGTQRLKRSDVRILAASSADLPALAGQGHFDPALHQQLSAFLLTLPPLRQRAGGIPMLVREFTLEVAQAYGLNVAGVSAGALARLEDYAWPGNVRELKQVIQRAVLLAREGELKESHLPPRLLQEKGGTSGALTLPAGQSLAQVEGQYMRLTLAHCQGNKSRAAGLLGISRKALYQKLARTERKAA